MHLYRTFWSLSLSLLAIIVIQTQASAQSDLVIVQPKATCAPVTTEDFGLNCAAWDSNLASPATFSLLDDLAVRAFRYPGGSWADGFDWTTSRFQGMPTTAIFAKLVERYNGMASIILNYGSGSPQMAAAWAAYCNAAPNTKVFIGRDSFGRDWKTASYWAALRGEQPLVVDDGLNLLRADHPQPYGFHYFEVGNECYGYWEEDGHFPKQDPVVYAQFFAATARLVKEIDPQAKLGAVISADEDTYGNQQESVVNPVTHQVHTGWTAVLLSTFRTQNIVPDSVIYHNYPQDPGAENDATLLAQSTSWQAKSNSIRSMLTSYLGPVGRKIEMKCTENNSVSANPGKETTSLVNALYFANSFGSLIETEFKGLYWWDLENGPQTKFNNSPALYGWRQYGDYGLDFSDSNLPGAAINTPYPVYFAMKLVKNFCQPGDIPLKTISTLANITAFAVSNPSSLSLLLVNNDPSHSHTVDIDLSGMKLGKFATIWQYGKSDDDDQSMGKTITIRTTRVIFVHRISITVPTYSIFVIKLFKTTSN